jgi:hypothetical protein
MIQLRISQLRSSSEQESVMHWLQEAGLAECFEAC